MKRALIPLRFLGCLVLLGFLSPDGWAAETPISPTARRQLLMPAYQALRSDSQFAALKQAFAAAPSEATRDRLLAHMPLSPLDYYEIDMQTRHYELAIPKFVHQHHLRWIELHADLARKLYGDSYVDNALIGFAVDLAPDAVSEETLKVLVATNRNVANAFSPEPLDYQGEIQIAVNPALNSQMVAAANTWDDIGGTCGDGIQAVFYSSDGGVTWGYTCPPLHTAYAGLTCALPFVFGSDPALFWNDNGEVFLNHMMICSNGAGDDRVAMVVARSTTGGATWTAQGVIVNSWGAPANFEDKNFYIIDNEPTSPFYGRHYTCWDRNNNEKVARSTNNGVTWTEVDIPTAPGGGFDLGCEMAVDDNGTVHMIFDTLTCPGATCNNERMFHTRSTDGGVTWTAPVLVRDFNLVGFSNANCPAAQNTRCINPFGAIGIDNSGGICDGTLYVTYSDFNAGGTATDTDVWLSRSTDNGATWSAPIVVNDAGTTGRTQFHPFLQVDATSGKVVVAWHDTRNDAANQKVDFFLTRSTTCGLSLEPNIQVSRSSSEFNNSGITYSNENSVGNVPGNPNQYGEYLGLDVVNDKPYVAWTDTRHFFPASTTETQKENVGFASVTFSNCDKSLGLPVGMLYRSVAADDGYVIESTEGSNVGGVINSTSATTSAIRAGDTSTDQQIKSILSFDTSSMPDTSCVLDARLSLKRGTAVGTNPFLTHGLLRVDIQTGGFNANVALEAADFQAAATVSTVCVLSNAPANGNLSECFFTNPAAMAAINRTGKTQMRIYFQSDDNDDLSNDYIGYWSGETATAGDRPTLILSFIP